MSEENVELVRRGYEHFAQTGEADASVYSPDVEWHSAAEVEMREWNVFLIVEGAIVSVHEYSDRETALRAAGLSE
jgi:hypothetical protein